MGKYIIRVIEVNDYYDIEYLAKRAFWNLRMPGYDEHYMIHRLWNDASFVPELSLLAESEGEIVGAVLYKKIRTETANGDVEVLSVGAICVKPELQKKGIGSMLMKKSMKTAKEHGYKAIIICGAPAYYLRHGFAKADRLRAAMPQSTGLDAFMGIELVPGSLNGITGKYFEAYICSGNIHDKEYLQRVEEFDKKFPYMEKSSAAAI